MRHLPRLCCPRCQQLRGVWSKGGEGEGEGGGGGWGGGGGEGGGGGQDSISGVMNRRVK